MTNKTNYEKAGDIGRRYGIRQGITDAGCAVAGLAGGVDLIAQYVNGGTVAEYLTGLGVIIGSGIVDNRISRLNKRNQAKAIKKLERDLIPFEVVDTSGAK